MQQEQDDDDFDDHIINHGIINIKRKSIISNAVVNDDYTQRAFARINYTQRSSSSRSSSKTSGKKDSIQLPDISARTANGHGNGENKNS